MSAERQRHGHTEPLSWSPRVWTAHTRQLSVFLTELFDPSLLQNAFTRQLSLISNLSWRQKLKSHNVCKETIRCLLRYLLAFLQTNRPTDQRTVLTLVSVFALHVSDLTVISGDGGDGSGQGDTYFLTRPLYNFQPCLWWPEQVFEATTWPVSNPESFLCLNRSSQPRHSMKNHKVSKLLFHGYIHFQEIVLSCERYGIDFCVTSRLCFHDKT